MTRAEEQIIRDARVAGLDMKLEVVVIPVPDVGPRQEVLRNASTVAAREQIVARGVKVSEYFALEGQAPISSQTVQALA